MRAVTFDKTGDSSVLQVRDDVAKPTPKPSEVLVKVEWAGVNFYDTYVRTGLYKFPLPFTTGAEGAGTIESVGADAAREYPNLSVGDRVAFMAPGSAAEYATAPAARVARLPEGVSTRDGAALLLQGLTAWTLVRDAHEVKAGEVVLVQAAAGGTGGLVVQMAKHLGATVIGTVSTDDKAELARAHGCDHVVVYTRDDVLAAVDEVTRGQGCHAVFSGVGAATFDADLAATRRRGSLVSFGNASGAVAGVDLLRLTPKNVRLLRPSVFGYVATRDEWEGRCAELFDLLARGAVKVHVGGTYALDTLARAHNDLTGKKTVGKLVVKVAE
ncbi:hypothetical protein RB594_009284 [Gaeumannomyces avenae]